MGVVSMTVLTVRGAIRVHVTVDLSGLDQCVKVKLEEQVS